MQNVAGVVWRRNGRRLPVCSEVPHECQSRLNGTCDERIREIPWASVSERSGDRQATGKPSSIVGSRTEVNQSGIEGMKVPEET